MKRYLLIGGTSACVFLLIMAVIMFKPSASPRASTQATPVAINNETESLQVVSSKIENNTLVLELKNTSNQPIVAYGIDFRRNSGIAADLTTTDNSLDPGHGVTVRIPLGQLERAENTGLYKIDLSMAFFADGSAEGDWEKARVQREKMEGAATALEQIQPRLTNIGQFSPSAVKQLSGEFSGLRPSQGLTKMQKFGYWNVITQARLRTQQVLLNPVQAKAERDFNALKSSIGRQVSSSRMNTERK
jgi:hypothetical protein